MIPESPFEFNYIQYNMIHILVLISKIGAYSRISRIMVLALPVKYIITEAQSIIAFQKVPPIRTETSTGLHFLQISFLELVEQFW